MSDLADIASLQLVLHDAHMIQFRNTNTAQEAKSRIAKQAKALPNGANIDETAPSIVETQGLLLLLRGGGGGYR